MAAVTVLNDQHEVRMASPGNSAQVELPLGPYGSRAVAFISASGFSTYSAAGNENAGIILEIDVNGNMVSSSDSFEGNSSNIPFRAAASHVFVLEPNTIASVIAKVVPEGGGGIKNHNTEVRLAVVALEAT